MKTIDNQELVTVAGGLSKADTLNSTLSSVQSSLRDLSSQKNNSGNDMLLPLAMMMAFRPQAPTVVAAGAAPVAAGPVINVSNRIGRRWW